MTSDSELRRRDELIGVLRTHTERVGVAALTMESAADAAGMTVTELGEYFDSKEDIVLTLIARNRILLRERFSQLLRDPSLDRTGVRRSMWEFYVETAADSQLFFEAYGLALRDERYREFATGINDWLNLLVQAAEAQGALPQQASAIATLTLAVYRGAMLDYCATGDRQRLNAAMELWFKLVTW